MKAAIKLMRFVMKITGNEMMLILTLIVTLALTIGFSLGVVFIKILESF